MNNPTDLRKYNSICRTKFFFYFLFFISSVAYCQLPAFTLNISHTNETCSGNATMTFSVGNTVPGSTITYSVFHLPDLTTPTAITTATSVGGLTAGTYKVVAVQTSGTLSNIAEQTVVITSSIVPLQYNLIGTNAICGADGKITVNTTQGNAVGYEIFSGPVIVPLQSSNVLTGLTAGVYQVRVFDACGEGVVQTYTLFNSNAALTIYVQSPLAGDCETLQIGLTINAASSSVIAYPLTIHCVVTTPSGTQLVFDQVVTSSTFGYVTYSEHIPYFEGEIYSYSVTITDNCGNDYVSNNTISNFEVNPTSSLFNSTCEDAGVYINNIIGLVLLTAPPEYTGAVPHDFTSEINGFNSITLEHLPVGTYTFMATGLCGQQVPMTVIVTPAVASAPFPYVSEGCEIGFGTFFLPGHFQSVTLTSAPAAYPGQSPADLSAFINTISGAFAMDNLPPGHYVLHTVDICGNGFDVTATIVGYTENTIVNVDENCNSFDLQLQHTSNNGTFTTYWLQKYDPVLNQWGHPGTGVPYPDNTMPTVFNSAAINNNATTYNLAYTGLFRIVKNFKVFEQSSASQTFCNHVIYNFEYIPGPKILNVYSFVCSDTAHDVIVDAVGLAPLTYRITSRDGLPYLIENATSSVFLGLTPAVYNFQVEDGCGNILNRLFDIPSPFPLLITPQGLCDGQTGSLSVPYFPFLTYIWWKGNDPSNVLSSNGALPFAPFNAATDIGTYHVRIFYNNPNSCIDITLDYDVLPGIANPEAGSGSSVSYCTSPQTIDLFSLLSGTVTSGGTWQDISGSGTLSGSDWSTTNVAAGTYHFKYVVTGACATVESEVIITLNSIPPTPTLGDDIVVCAGSEITLSAPQEDLITYEWSGPNNFSSSDSTIILADATAEMSGTYFLTLSNETCTSLPASVNVSVSPPPAFSILANCNDNRFSLAATPIGDSFAPDSANYSWTGPENFSAQGNPIDITGEIQGTYTATVVTDSGCSASLEIELAATLCTVPLGISPNGDGLNDVFNLAGFDVENLEIFNRYGMVVFEQGHYRSEWHGQDYKGRDLPAGAYYYLIKLGGGEVKSGWVYVNRKW
jgi:gliding motility-associated-like protein